MEIYCTVAPMDTSARKKILFVITKSNWGGAQQYVFTLATHFKEEGFEVTVALGGTGEAGAQTGLLAERLKQQHIPIIFLTSLTRDISLSREFLSFFELHRIIKKINPDILHLNSSKVGGIGALAGRTAGIKNIIFTAHGWAHREARNPVSKLLIWLASWATILLSHKTITVSKFDYHDSPVFFSRRKIHVVRNGIRAHHILPKKEQAMADLKTIIPSFPKEIPLIISVGELTKNKNHELLIGALARITEPFFCVILGEGEEHVHLEELIATYKLNDRVALPGFIPNASSLLPAADIFVLPSRKEGLPFTLLEAGMAALPVIATATGGIPEITDDQNAGILFPNEDVEALTLSIEKLLRGKRLRTELGNTLKTRVLKEFSEETMLQQTEKIYE